MEKLAELNGVVAVYEYHLPYGEIPLVIIDDEIDWETLKHSFGRSEGCVLLTHNDLKHGRDVFALRYLHMQERSEHIGGKNILKDLELKKDHIRYELENTLRILLIDLREMILLRQTRKIARHMMALALDRILVGIEMLEQKHHKKFEKYLEDAIQICHIDQVTHEFLVELYQHLEEMTGELDA